jgi:alpha,alpha-trehalase
VAEGGLRNNAYTNIMAVWCIERALEVLNKIDPERRNDLIDILDIEDEEIQRWHDITHKMTIHFHGDGIISQFQGFEELEEFPWEEYRKKYGDIHRLDRILKAEGSSPDRYKVAKQPDVTMLFYLLRPEEIKRIFNQLGYVFDEETIAGNIRYYMARCSHGSTLAGSCSGKPYVPISRMSKAEPRRKGFTWAPWPAPSTSSSTATPVSIPPVKPSPLIPTYPSPSVAFA